MISVSYLKSKFSKEETIKKIDESLADAIHVDLMDGVYAGVNNFVISEVINDLKNTTKPLDIHLMVKKPLKYIKNLIQLKPIFITVHLKSCCCLKKVLKYVRNNNIKVGIAINPNENITKLNKYFQFIDYVLIMGVIPGKGGQKFIPTVLEKIEYLQDKNVMIGIDGGINEESIQLIKDYRIDNIISGSYICMNDDYNKYIQNLIRGYNE